MTEQDKGKRPDPAPTGSAADEAQLLREVDSLRDDWTGLGREEPPALLDQAVRNAAHRAVARRRPGGRRIPWLSGMATAAVAVLAISLYWLQPGSGPPAPAGVDGFRVPAPAESAETARESRAERADMPVETASEESATRRAAAAPGADSQRMKSASPAAAAPAADAVSVTEAPAGPAIPEAFEREGEAEPPPTPEAWIARLLELRATGQSDRLAAELARFRAIYPDHPLPAELEE